MYLPADSTATVGGVPSGAGIRRVPVALTPSQIETFHQIDWSMMGAVAQVINDKEQVEGSDTRVVAFEAAIEDRLAEITGGSTDTMGILGQS